MAEFLIAVLIAMLAPAVMIFLGLPKNFEIRSLIDRSRPPELVRNLQFRDFISHVKLTELINRLKFLVLCKINPGFGPHFAKSREMGTLPRSGVGFSAGRLTVPRSGVPVPDQSIHPSAQPDLAVLNCRVQPTKQQEGNCVFNAFTVQIAGSIHAPSDPPETDATLRISIMDVTDGIDKAKPVQAKVKQWPAPDSPVFCYNADLGKLPHQVTTLSDWTAVAQINIDELEFARKGERNLLFGTSILSRQSGQELACAKCNFTYDNPEFGYIDLQENIQRRKTLAVALAFAVSAADQKLYDCEIELIRNWARDNFDVAGASDKGRGNLEKALDKTVAFFRDGNQLNIYEICKEIVEIAPLAGRYDILDLCLHVAQANGRVVAEELAILKNLASWLEADANRFRAMMERTLPVHMHQVKDAEVIFGVTSDMSKEKTRRQLNKQYSKWNSRVISSDPEIRAQA
ncbi:MAG: tellurite resistance TerB family protein, partial [Phycisphaerae bacterium]